MNTDSPSVPAGAGTWTSRCLHCGTVAVLDDHPDGCPRCAQRGIAAPMMPARPAVPARRPGPAPAGVGALWRWAELLVPVGRPVSLGEGGTPLVALRPPPRPAGLAGVRLLLKDERSNPTGSFKDRLCSMAVSRARDLDSPLVALATSGNAGISAAAYAAAAGMRCVVLSTRGLPGPTAAALGAVGARLVLTRTAEDRWTALRAGVEHLGWFPLTNYRTPPVSSNAPGVAAYRTIAYEIAESLGWQAPDWVVVPVSRGDGLYGLWSGFADLLDLGWTASVPRMLAVERFPSLGAALRDGAEQPGAVAATEAVQARSIGDRRGTVMALDTLRRSGGLAVTCDDRTMWAAWRHLAAQGTVLELSSAAAWHGAEELARRGELAPGATVVLLGTAAPYAQASFDADPHAVELDTDPADPATLRRVVA